MDIEKEEKMFCGYNGREPFSPDEYDMLSVWIARAELVHQETQALQEELIKTNAEKLHAKMVADAAIEELKALKEKLKDGVIVPREPTHEMLRAAYKHVMDCHATPESAYKVMLEEAEQSHD